MRQADEPFLILIVDTEKDCLVIRDTLIENRIKNPTLCLHDSNQVMPYLHHQGTYHDSLRPGLILLDVDMPHKNAWELAAEIQADSELRDIPVLLLSAAQPDDSGAKKKQVVKKPVTFQAIIEILVAMQQYWIEIVKSSTANV